MPKPWEMTCEDARAEADALREDWEAADREAAWLFAQQLADLAEEDEEVQAEDESSATDGF